MNTPPHLHALVPVGVSLLLAAACGATDDAPGDLDAGGGLAPITVVATSRYGTIGAPQAGVRAFATSPDGTPGSAAVTDDAGVAVLDDVPAGSSVTAIYDDVDRVAVTTVVDVAPGDMLRFGAADPFIGPEVGEMTVAFPPAQNSSGYAIYDGCAHAFPPASATSVTVRRYAHCNAATMDLLLVSQTATSDVGSWAVVEDVPFVAGTTYTYAGTWNPASTFDVAVSGIAPEVSSVVVQLGNRMNQGRLNMLWTRELAVTDGSVAASVPWAAAGDDIYTFFGVNLDEGASYGRAALVPATTRSIALAPPAIPAISAIAFDADRRLRWTESGGGSYDVLAWHLAWTAPSTSGERGYAWDVIAPRREATSLALPTLPPPFADPTTPRMYGTALDWEDHDAAFVRSLPTWKLTEPLTTEDSLDHGPIGFFGFDD